MMAENIILLAPETFIISTIVDAFLQNEPCQLIYVKSDSVSGAL